MAEIQNGQPNPDGQGTDQLPRIPISFQGGWWQGYQWAVRIKQSTTAEGAAGSRVLILEFTETTQPEGDPMSLLSQALPDFDWTNPVASIDALIENAIKSKAPSSSALQPELNAEIEASVALVKKLTEVYAFAKAGAELAKFIDYASGKFPVIAPELAALKAKIPV
jgi:hypothetical protein